MSKKYIILIAVALIFFGVFGRIFPHAPNMTPLIALTIVSSLYLGNKYWSLILPIGALAISDLFIGLYDWRIMVSVYLSFALAGILSWIVQKNRSFLNIAAILFASSFLFFLITNGAVWLFSPWYEKNILGLLYAYELGLPFFRNMFVGDILYTAGLVLVFEIVYVMVKLKKQTNLKLLPFLNH